MNYYVESENSLEEKLIEKLKKLGYSDRTNDIKDINDVNRNIKHHLERLNSNELNNISLDENDFQKFIIDKISNSTVFENAKRFRDHFLIQKNNNRNYRLSCFDKNNTKNNVFEFSRQIIHKNKNDLIKGNSRSDLTIFLNGFPVVQIELKKKNVDVMDAYKQIIRYKDQVFDFNVFKIVQIFIISNDVITKYCSNNDSTSNKNFNSTKNLFNWTDKNNTISTNVVEFAESFLNADTLFKMISNYMVINEKDKRLMILRPYQFYAVESIIKKIDDTNSFNETIENIDERNKLNGFIWHATGSGKTLTSFKTVQVLESRKDIDKVIFLVDRLDLNNQTTEEFQKFLGENWDEIEDVENIRDLTNYLKDPSKRMIVTTMQKMDRLIKKEKNLDKNKNIIFIIDECHRSQFGDMHKLLRKTFSRSRMFGFTGTPIFAHNNKNFMTTDQIFGECLHKYLMKHAINDKNVLGFLIEYVKGPKEKLTIGNDIEAESLDLEEFFKSDNYMDKIVDFIAKNNESKTINNYFKSMLVVKDIESAVKYYWKFREKYPDINVASLFTSSNDENINDERLDKEKAKNVKIELSKIINDYNQIYNDANCSIDDFKGYSTNVQNKLKEQSTTIQIIIVVRMLTTGFDSQWINTIYLDKTLKGYELIQTISRANRTSISSKTTANVVSFRTFKKDVDDALCLYNSEKSVDVIYVKDSLDELYEKINNCIKQIKDRWPTHSDIANETSEIQQKDFVVLMKELNKILLLAKNFIEYDDKKINISPNELENYRQIQIEIYRKNKKDTNKVSVLDSIDFELEIFKVDEINNDYIFNTLEKLKNRYLDKEEFLFKVEKIIEKIRKEGISSKSKLIEMFINEWKEKMLQEDIDWKDKNISDAYNEFKIKKVKNKILEYSKEHNLDYPMMWEIIVKKTRENKPIEFYREEIKKTIKEKLGFLERKKLSDEIESFLISIDDEYYFENFLYLRKDEVI